MASRGAVVLGAMLIAAGTGCRGKEPAQAASWVQANAPGCGQLMDSAAATQSSSFGAPYGESAAGIPSYRAWVSAAFKNRMSSAFVLVEAQFSIDGNSVCGLVGERLDEVKELGAFEGAIAPGEHQIDVRLVFRGHGNGVFSYLKGYRFNVQSSHRLEAKGGERIQVLLVAQEKGGPTTALEERPEVIYQVRSTR